MAGEFKIEVPIDVKTSKEKTGGGGGLGFKKLTGAVLAGNIATKVLSSMLQGLTKLLEPVLKILNVLFVLIFLPLMPLIKAIATALGKLAGQIVKSVSTAEEIIPKASGDTAIGELYNSLIRPFIVFGTTIGDLLTEAFIRPVFEFGEKIGDWLYNAVITPAADAITSVILWIVNLLKNVFNAVGTFLINIGTWIWDFILDGLDFIKDLGVKIWDFIKNGLSFISNLGQMIWNWISSALGSIGGGIKSLFGGGRAEGGPVSGGQSYLVGEKGPELFSPGTSGNITPNGGQTNVFNISGNNFNNEQDMRKMVDMISKKLQQSANRSFSR